MIPNPRHFGRIGKASIEELKEQIILNKLRYSVSPCCPISEKLRTSGWIRPIMRRFRPSLVISWTSEEVLQVADRKTQDRY